jgi:hypothetical protein
MSQLAYPDTIEIQIKSFQLLPILGFHVKLVMDRVRGMFSGMIKLRMPRPPEIFLPKERTLSFSLIV